MNVFPSGFLIDTMFLRCRVVGRDLKWIEKEEENCREMGCQSRMALVLYQILLILILIFLTEEKWK